MQLQQNLSFYIKRTLFTCYAWNIIVNFWLCSLWCDMETVFQPSKTLQYFCRRSVLVKNCY